jgi:hypothetical protein
MSIPVPEFAVGEGRAFKISASQIASRGSVFGCPAGTALQARLAAGSLRPNDATRWRKTWDPASMLNFAIRDGFYRLSSGRPIAQIVMDEPKLTHAQRRFVQHALEQLQDLPALASDACGVMLTSSDELDPVAARPGGLMGSVTLFARHLASGDGATHEAVRMRLKPLKEPGEEDEDWTAVAALVLTLSFPDAARLRVSEFSLADGGYRATFDGDGRQARERYESCGQLLPEALGRLVFNPGSNCASCGFLAVCPAVPMRRGVLGVPGRAVATRALSATDLATYTRCPTAFLAQRRDHLPRAMRDDGDDELGEQARARGTAAHSVLRWLHSRTPAVGCQDSDVPDPAVAPDAAAVLAELAGVAVNDYTVAHPYLRHHIDLCLLGFDGIGEWRPEQRVVRFDADADIVVVTTPDLTGVTDGGEPIWRETKTANWMPPDVEAALEVFPAFALNVAVLACEAPGRWLNAHAELEVLSRTGGQVFVVSLDEGQLVSFAQKIVADTARRYAADTEFARRVSNGCDWCPSFGWCQPTLAVTVTPAVATEVDDDEFTDDEPPF